jgi:hypothetical protein
MKSVFELFKRQIRSDVKDTHSINNEVYNEPSGANKIMIVEPVVVAPVLATALLPFGSYVKVTGTSYTLQLLNKAHNPAVKYRRNDMVTQAGRVYVAEVENIGAFNIEQWRDVAPATVGPITVVAGSVVCNGKYHNNINAAGFLVDDDTEILKVEI